MAFEIITSSSVEPVDLQEVKDFLRLTHCEDDTFIESILIPTARQVVEAYLRVSFINKTYKMYLDGFPSEIEIKKYPIREIEEIKYTDTDGNLQTLSEDDYEFDIKSDPARIRAKDTVFPATKDLYNAVSVQFICGYGADATSIPERIKTSIFIICNHLFFNRGLITHLNMNEIPTSMKILLAPFKRIRF